jgi:hypothetical protein
MIVPSFLRETWSTAAPRASLTSLTVSMIFI